MLGWQDGSTANPRTIIVPAQSTTYTANFKTQYFATVLASPPTGGTVTGGGWIDAGGTATVTATANAGYRFVNWSGATTTTANPTFLQMYGPQTITANFTPVTNAPPGTWSVMQIATSATAYSINSFGQVAGQSSGRAFLWTPVAANSTAGTLMDLSASSPNPLNSVAAAVNDSGQVLLTLQCCPSPSASPAILWTPTTPQGSSGSTTSISNDNTGSGAVSPALNNFGQVATTVAGSPAIWTPTTAHGMAGTATSNAQFQGLRALNGFGQAIMNSGSGVPLLFTPNTHNTTTGTFTAITGLAGATQHTLVGINDSGVVVGYSCVTQVSAPCQNMGFIWTPSSANGTTGNTVQMAIPAGFVAVVPTTINAAGNIVGQLMPSTGSAVPFLYTAGTYYDLTAISGVPVGAIPEAINQVGQVILNDSPYGNGNIYLVTPPGGALSHTPAKVGVFRSGFLWIEDVDGNMQFDSPPDRVFPFGGLPGDLPITGDWNGDGTSKVGIYRSSSGVFLLDYNGDGLFDLSVDKVYNLGVGIVAGDVPVVGDWNGDGRTKVGLFRQGYFWILDYDGNGVFNQSLDKAFPFGGARGDIPVVGDWNGSGTSKVGLFRAGFFWLLDTNGNGQ